MKAVAERLKNLREGLKLPQTKIAQMIGTSQVSINRYESDKGSPTLETLLWYADYFDVSLDWVFGRTDKPQGKLYDYQPKYIEEKTQDNDELKLFIEMCFDPKSPMNEKLKQSLIKMVERGKINE